MSKINAMKAFMCCNSDSSEEDDVFGPHPEWYITQPSKMPLLGLFPRRRNLEPVKQLRLVCCAQLP